MSIHKCPCNGVTIELRGPASEHFGIEDTPVEWLSVPDACKLEAGYALAEVSEWMPIGSRHRRILVELMPLDGVGSNMVFSPSSARLLAFKLLAMANRCEGEV